jgi:hypothetical protein
VSAHHRYAVALKGGGFVGSKVFSYATGTQNGNAKSEGTARMFTRLQDATHMARETDGRVVTVLVTFP